MVQYVLDSVWAGGVTSFNTIMEIENILLDGVAGTGNPVAWTVEPGSHTLTYTAHNLTNFPLNAYGYVLAGTTTYSPWGQGHGATPVTIPALGTYNVTVPLTISTTFNGSIYIGHITGDTYQFTANATTGGYITGTGCSGGGGCTGTYAEGTSISLVAHYNTGYQFDGWSSSDITITEPLNPNLSFIMPAFPVTLYANFSLLGTVQKLYTVSAGSGGSLTGDQTGSYDVGDTITTTAVPAGGYTFYQWTAIGITIANPTNPTLSFTMPNNDVIALASFTSGGAENPVDVVYDPGQGSVSGEGTYTQGEPVTLTAYNAPGYTFNGWTGDCSLVATNCLANPLVFTMPANPVNITANFTSGNEQGVNWMLIGAAIGGIALIGIIAAFSRRQPAPVRR